MRGIVDLTHKLDLKSIQQLLAAGRLSEARYFADAKSDFTLDEVSFLPVIPEPAHCYCVGVNYADHLREVQDAGIPRPKPKQPSLFIRYPETFVGQNKPLLIPKVSDQFDYEAGLAVILGKAGRYIPRGKAYDHVAGYSCFIDGSIRDWQFHSNQVTSGKNFLGTGAFGPWMVTPDEIGVVEKLAVSLSVNGTVLQNSTTSDMLFDVGEIVAYASAFLPLQPDDVIATGTPAGVGFSRKPPIFLKPGDLCRVHMENIGTLENRLENAKAD